MSGSDALRLWKLGHVLLSLNRELSVWNVVLLSGPDMGQVIGAGPAVLRSCEPRPGSLHCSLPVLVPVVSYYSRN